MNELKITGAQLESLEHYVDLQREIGAPHKRERMFVIGVRKARGEE